MAVVEALVVCHRGLPLRDLELAGALEQRGVDAWRRAPSWRRAGAATIAQLATRAGRGKVPGLSPRNLLDLTDRPKGSGRASFQGSPDEVAVDVRRAQKLGAEWMTFDLPRVDVPGMKRAMERLVKEVKPASV